MVRLKRLKILYYTTQSLSEVVEEEMFNKKLNQYLIEIHLYDRNAGLFILKRQET